MLDSKKIVEQSMDAIMRHDIGSFKQMLHEKYSYTGTDGQRQEGPQVGIAIVEMYTNAFPDLSMDIQSMHMAGNIVITEFIARGTHKGELMGVMPTNRSVALPVCNIAEIREGKIYAEREYFDNVCLLQQLGVEVGHEHA